MMLKTKTSNAAVWKTAPIVQMVLSPDQPRSDVHPDDRGHLHDEQLGDLDLRANPFGDAPGVVLGRRVDGREANPAARLALSAPAPRVPDCRRRPMGRRHRSCRSRA